ncbi:MAG: cyclic nucleotide-binding domain-containing protein [Gemmatimonadetes bacterium]|nr:cyclic nucleotide-binding domain-containing protein [Gemmatimonadota bacterium]
MRKVRYILGELEDDDAEWLARAGARRRVPRGEVLIHEGGDLDSVFFVTQGTFTVSTGSARQAVATVGVGEVLGEVSFIDRSPPTATVTAAEDAAVLAISRAALNAKIKADPGFGGRFYKAVAVFLAERLRSTLRRLGSRASASDDELDLEALDSLSKGGVRFERILQRLQRV